MLYLGLYDNNYVGSGLSLKLMFITSLFVQTRITSLPIQWYSRATPVYTLMTLQTNTNVSQIHWLNDKPHFPLSISRNFALKEHILLIFSLIQKKNLVKCHWTTKSPCQDHLAWWVGNSSPMPLETPGWSPVLLDGNSMARQITSVDNWDMFKSNYIIYHIYTLNKHNIL